MNPTQRAEYLAQTYQAWRKAPAFRHGDISHTLFTRKEAFLVLH